MDSLEHLYRHSVSSMVKELIELIKGDIRSRLELQGHNNTYALSNSLETVVDTMTAKVVGKLLAFDYWQRLDKGTSAEAIPRPGQPGYVAYVSGLVEYFRKRKVVEPIAAARRTAIAHAIEGSPTRASRRFSRTGKRTGAFSDPIKENELRIEELVERHMEEAVISQLNVIVDGQNAGI